MPRVKGGYVTRQRRKKVLKLAKGYFGSKHTLYKTAHEQVMRSLAYSYRDRKVRKRDFRKLWIQRINAACQLNGMKYSRFINGLNRAGIEVNRKMLAEMAVNDANGFAQLVELAKQGLVNEPVVKEPTYFSKYWDYIKDFFLGLANLILYTLPVFLVMGGIFSAIFIPIIVRKRKAK